MARDGRTEALHYYRTVSGQDAVVVAATRCPVTSLTEIPFRIDASRTPALLSCVLTVLVASVTYCALSGYWP